MIRWLLIFIFIGGVSLQLSRYAEWQPTVYRYCETIQNTSLIGGGITCGYSSYNVMNNLFASTTISITSSISLGLINVGWITTYLLSNEFNETKCFQRSPRKSDGILEYVQALYAAACALVVNPPSGLPNCTDDQNNLVYRSGSGYCMKSQVCGASVEITFLKSADDACWTPTVTRYCETVQDSTNPLSGGITCGISSWTVMQSINENLAITSTTSLGLINVGWITTAALNTESKFWKTCKAYMIRIFDGIYQNSAGACALVSNPPTGLPNCTDSQTNLMYRSGSGYCMKSKVCGASIEISFLKSADNSSLIWSWVPATITSLTANGYTKVASCYTYKTLPNPTSSQDNMYNADLDFY
uniref:CW domain-containing protein n=1 Tax=Caenorhabditis tropicalis TaxID=1561998 RepID=A0A1I7TG91_9PELO